MKKLVALVLVMGMVFSFAACDLEDKTKDKVSQEKTSQTGTIANTTKKTQQTGSTANNTEESVPASTKKESASTPTSSSVSIGKRNALKKANSYLDFMAFSYAGLIQQLEYEKFTLEEATYAADNCGANWKDQALKKAATYLETLPFSHSGLIKQLEYEKFTLEEATYAADNCSADWNEQAVKKAQSYLEIMSFSKEGLIHQLEYEGFTNDQAEYAVAAVGY